MLSRTFTIAALCSLLLIYSKEGFALPSLPSSPIESLPADASATMTALNGSHLGNGTIEGGVGEQFYTYLVPETHTMIRVPVANYPIAPLDAVNFLEFVRADALIRISQMGRDEPIWTTESVPYLIQRVYEERLFVLRAVPDRAVKALFTWSRLADACQGMMNLEYRGPYFRLGSVIRVIDQLTNIDLGWVTLRIEHGNSVTTYTAGPTSLPMVGSGDSINPVTGSVPGAQATSMGTPQESCIRCAPSDVETY